MKVERQKLSIFRNFLWKKKIYCKFS